MNLKWALVTVLLALALLQTIEAEKERKSRRKSLTKGALRRFYSVFFAMRQLHQCAIFCHFA